MIHCVQQSNPPKLQDVTHVKMVVILMEAVLQYAISKIFATTLLTLTLMKMKYKTCFVCLNAVNAITLQTNALIFSNTTVT